MSTKRKTSRKPSVPIKPKYPETIRFSKTVKRLFREMLNRHSSELNQALKEVYEDLNLLDRLQSGDEKFEVLPGLTGVKITRVKGREEKDKTAPNGGK